LLDQGDNTIELVDLNRGEPSLQVFDCAVHISSNPDVIRRDDAGKLGTPADAMTHVPRRRDSPKNISAAAARPDSNYFISSKPLRRLSYCP
jgi:hypothetical protein